MFLARYCALLHIPEEKRNTFILPALFLKPSTYGLGLPELRTPILGTILCNLAQFLNSANPITSQVATYVFSKDHHDRHQCRKPTFPTFHSTINILHSERRILVQTPFHQSINSKANRLYPSIFSTDNVIIVNKDALYETSLRTLLPEQQIQSYLLVIDGSHVHETEDFSSKVQAQMASFTSLPPPDNYGINQAIFANPTLGHYGHTVWQRKNGFTRGENTLIWIYQEEPAVPQYTQNLPCSICTQEFTGNAKIIQCTCSCCQCRAHQICYETSAPTTTNNKAVKTRKTWRCPDCTLDDKTFPKKRFCGTPVKDWFLYQLVKNHNDTAYYLKGVSHTFQYSQFFEKNSAATCQERYLYKICRGSTSYVSKC